MASTLPGGKVARARWPGLRALLRPSDEPFALQLLGRTLLHAALVGAAAGLAGAAFLAALEYAQRLVLEDLAGYVILRAHGETFVGAPRPTPFRPWLLALLPAAGAFLGGMVSQLAPETRGGGGDQMIQAFHRQGGVIRRRVAWVKGIAAILTLGGGGSGGREGPTMHIGAALGSSVARLLRVGTRERRILMVAGVAAGIAAVFRTPLGAALLAVEVLYRDDFESDALVPAVLASVVAYSVVISIFGESTLFARAPRYPFHALHLPLYLLLALCTAGLASGFVRLLRAVERKSAALRVPGWVRPGLGGLAVGVLAVPVILYVGARTGVPGQGLGILGGGYGAAQTAITGSRFLPEGWRGIELLLLLCGAKLIASALTIGSGGCAGDFAPSLVLGGVFGGAFGRAAQLLLHDPTIDPGAFALVGMGTFYGGVAHVPVSSLILVSELAGSYDLLVPLMLAEGIAFLALRKRTLYPAQLTTKAESPVHRSAFLPEVLTTICVGEVMQAPTPYLSFDLHAQLADMVAQARGSTQEAFPVVDGEGKLLGTVAAPAVTALADDADDVSWMIAADLMQPAAFVCKLDTLQAAARKLLGLGLRELPVADGDGRIAGFLHERDLARAYLSASADAAPPGDPPRPQRT
jgi:CIC family chloride channel protein